MFLIEAIYVYIVRGSAPLRDIKVNIHKYKYICVPTPVYTLYIFYANIFPHVSVATDTHVSVQIHYVPKITKTCSGCCVIVSRF